MGLSLSPSGPFCPFTPAGRRLGSTYAESAPCRAHRWLLRLVQWRRGLAGPPGRYRRHGLCNEPGRGRPHRRRTSWWRSRYDRRLGWVPSASTLGRRARPFAVPRWVLEFLGLLRVALPGLAVRLPLRSGRAPSPSVRGPGRLYALEPAPSRGIETTP